MLNSFTPLRQARQQLTAAGVSGVLPTPADAPRRACGGRPPPPPPGTTPPPGVTSPSATTLRLADRQKALGTRREQFRFSEVMFVIMDSEHLYRSLETAQE